MLLKYLQSWSVLINERLFVEGRGVIMLRYIIIMDRDMFVEGRGVIMLRYIIIMDRDMFVEGRGGNHAEIYNNHG